VSASAVVGYIRVSSPSQDYAYQRSAIDVAARARGEKVDEWFADVTSGATMQRPNLGRLWARLGAGGVRRVWVYRLDRISRAGIAETLAAVQQVRKFGADLSFVADPLPQIEGPTGEIAIAFLAYCAQMQRLQIRETQDAARARLERDGRAWGRPELPDSLKDAVRALASQKFSVREIARQLKVSKSWVHKILKRPGH